jgi:restriction endonuclease S subunit
MAGRKRAAGRDSTNGMGMLWTEPDPLKPVQLDDISDVWPGEQRIPKTWKWVRVEDVGDVRLGRQRSPENRAGEYATKYIRAANITWRGLDLIDLLEMEFEPHEREIYRLQNGDIVLSEASGSADQVGRPAIWRNEVPLCCFQNTVIRFRPAGISSEFSYLVFRHLAESGVFPSLARGVGIGHLGSDRFARIAFPLPPIAEQERIAKRMTRITSRLVRVEASLSRAEKNVQLSRLAAFRDAMRGDLGVIKAKPSGWLLTPVGDLCTATNGRAFKTSEWSAAGIPIIRIQNLRDSNATFNFFSGEVAPQHIVERGDLLFAWSGTPGTSFGAFIWDGSKGALNQHIFKLECDTQKVLPRYLFHALNYQLDRYIAAAQGGGGLAHISRSEFLNSTVILPPLAQQAQIVHALESRLQLLDRQTRAITASIERLKHLRQSLLYRAISGNLTPQKKSDVSVNDLLGEIRIRRAKQAAELHAIQVKRRTRAKADRGIHPRRVKRDLYLVLSENGPMTAARLFQAAGYSEDDGEDVVRFYRALAAAAREETIAVEERQPKDKSLCKVGTK